MTSPSALVFYHYLYPDDVVSAVHLGELCQGLAQRGWRVTARPSNRGCRDDKRTYPSTEMWEGVHIKRVRRPRFRQSSALGRILNILWMLTAWSLDALRTDRKPDVLIIGTDPILSVLVAIVWKAVRPKTKIVHWCFDLYPEAAFADGLLSRHTVAARCMQALVKRAYGCCDLVVNIGSCMQKLLDEYGSDAESRTFVPWALEEPDLPLPVPPDERAAAFGDAKLGLMYSGTYGRAHTNSDLLNLSRALRGAETVLAFSARGNRVEDLRRAVTIDDSNVRFVPFAAADKLQDRLAAADVHIVSLREEWTGTVVPSKFFGALAIGRPVLFFGSRESSIAECIAKHRVGWVWDSDRSSEITSELTHLISSPERMTALRRHCHTVYREHFSKDTTIAQWDYDMRQLLRPRASGAQASAQLLIEENAWK